MDLYTSGDVQTEFVDPVSFVPNARCAFELQGNKIAYLSNIRLLDIGLVSNGTHNYSRGLGTLALIKNIRLLDARTELGSLRNPAQYLFFKNSNRTNATNKSNDSFMKANQLGLEINSTTGTLDHVHDPAQATNDANTSGKGYLDLRECFPILNRLPALPTNMFRNLRIEVEFDSAQANQILTDITATIAVERPVLCVDHTDNLEMVNKAMEGVMKNGVVWNEIEHDNFLLPAVDTTAYANTDEVRVAQAFQSMAYRGKYVERMILCKQVVDKTKELNGNNPEGYGAIPVEW